MIKMGKTANILIPSLISLFNDYNNNLRTRLKADTLFLSYDERSKKTFNKFIHLSNDRFKLMKYGGELNNIISNQMLNYSKINKDIQNDLLFNTNYSNAERKKLIKSVNKFKSKEIFKVRDELYETLKQRTAIDIMLREKQILQRKAQRQRNKLKKMSTSKKSHNGSNENEKNKLFENGLDSAEKIVKDTIKEDQDNLINGMESYKNLLKSKKIIFNNFEPKKGNNNKFIKINKNEFSDIESHLNENNIKILSYNEENSDIIEKKKDIDEKFDINCLYKIKKNCTIMNQNNKDNKNTNIYFFPKININTETFFNKPENIKSKQKKNMKSLTFNNYDMKNTIKIIKQEAYNGEMLGEKFQNQKKIFDTYYNRHFPKRFFSKIEKKNKLKQKLQKLKDAVERGKTAKVKKKRRLSNYERILEDYQKIYDKKKEIWKKEEKEKEIIVKNNEKKEQDIINFLLNLEEKDKNKGKKKST